MLLQSKNLADLIRWRPGLLWLVGWLIELGLLLTVQSLHIPDEARLNFKPDALSASNIGVGMVSGFYKPETDGAKNQFVWTAPQTELKLDLDSPEDVTLIFELRSAAFAGGPDQPVRVLVNRRQVAQLQPDPHNPDFTPQTVSFNPDDFAERPLQISLESAAFLSPTDHRQLGTMVKSMGLESRVWASLSPRWHKLIWGLLALIGLMIGLGTLARRRKVGRAGWATLLIAGAALLLIGLAALDLAPLRLWLTDKNPYSAQSLVLLGTALLILVWSLQTPVLGVGSPSLYEIAYRRLGLRATPVPKRRLPPLPALTGLRMVAAALVFLFHSHGAFVLPGWAANFLRAGDIGVPLFFVLSGFVICYNYFPALSRAPLSQSWPFVVARVARIYPMYLFVLVLSLGAVGFESNPARRDVWGTVQHLSVVQAWNPDRDFLDLYVYNGQAWTLTVELFLYACFPLLAWLVLRHCRRLWQLVGLAGLVYGLTVSALSLAWLNGGLNDVDDLVYWANHVPLIHLADFVLGCVAARFYVLLTPRPVSARENRWGSLLLLGSIAAIVALMCGDEPAWFEPYRYGLAYLPFFTVLIFCLARYRTALGLWLSTRLMVRLGEASYSFYLLHQYLLIGELSSADSLTIYLYVPMLFGVCCLVSLAAYQYIESPARRLLQRLARPVAIPVATVRPRPRLSVAARVRRSSERS